MNLEREMATGMASSLLACALNESERPYVSSDTPAGIKTMVEDVRSNTLDIQAALIKACLVDTGIPVQTENRGERDAKIIEELENALNEESFQIRLAIVDKAIRGLGVTSEERTLVYKEMHEPTREVFDELAARNLKDNGIDPEKTSYLKDELSKSMQREVNDHAHKKVFGTILGAAVIKRRKKPEDTRTNAEIAADLKKFSDTYNKENNFKAGDLVTWAAPEFANFKVPTFDQPAIILRVLTKEDQVKIHEFTDDTSEMDAPAMADVVIGISRTCGDADCQKLHYCQVYAESWRFKAYDQANTETKSDEPASPGINTGLAA